MVGGIRGGRVVGKTDAKAAVVEEQKEANPPELGGSATGVINFINFTFSALLGPVFGSRLVQESGGDDATALTHYQAGFQPLLYGVVLALVLTCFLKETGLAARSVAADE